MKIRYFTDISQVPQIKPGELPSLERVGEQFAFRANSYYLGLINWDDPDDPIRKIIIPQKAELIPWGELDASNEADYKVAPGLEHKYPDTALFLLTNVCGGYCRFCFRKRLFMNDNNEPMQEIGPALVYLKKHREINNLLLTGGDPLILSTRKLENVISETRKIDHIKTIRIGTKMLAFNPYRIIDDPSLSKLVRKYSTPEKRIYFMSHFNHPREITEEAIEAIRILLEAGAIITNQTPLIRGVNDNALVLSELFNKLTFIGAPPYYVFIGRPTLGNRTYAVPLDEAYQIVERAKMRVSGLARRARLVMSHATGKIEIAGLTQSKIYVRYHRAANPEDDSRFLVFKRDDNAYWFDDLQIAVDQYVVKRRKSPAQSHHRRLSPI